MVVYVKGFMAKENLDTEEDKKNQDEYGESNNFDEEFGKILQQVTSGFKRRKTNKDDKEVFILFIDFLVFQIKKSISEEVYVKNLFKIHFLNR
jgi:hypothetical protein